MSDDAAETPQQYENLGKWLAAGQATFVAVAGAIGVTTGGIQRIFRNNSGDAVLWLGFIAFGILMGVLVSNGTGKSTRMLAGHLLLATVGTTFAALAAMWTALGLDEVEEPAPIMSFLFWFFDLIRGLSPWIFFILLLGLAVAWPLIRLPERWKGLISDGLRQRLDKFFTKSWAGLFTIGVASLLMVVLFLEPSRRATAGVVGGLLIAGAIAWAVHHNAPEEDDEDDDDSEDSSEQVVNVNVRFPDPE